MKKQIVCTWLLFCCLLFCYGTNAHEQAYSDCHSVPTNCGELKSFIGATIWHLGKQWRYAMERALKPLNITYPQFVLLATLDYLTKDGKKVTQMEVSRLADLDAKGSSQVFITREEKKFIKRKHTGEGKCIHPSITPLGKKILEQSVTIIGKADVAFFGEFTKKQFNAAIKLHQLIHE
ncbi:MAG: MarR family winged helix-turn-helix transcriptional regulator [Candidatus Babeliales bacterium]